MEKRKAKMIGMIVKEIKDEKLQAGWNIMQSANEQEMEILRKSSKDDLSKRILESKFGPSFAEIATNIMSQKSDEQDEDDNQDMLSKD